MSKGSSDCTNSFDDLAQDTNQRIKIVLILESLSLWTLYIAQYSKKNAVIEVSYF
jgi:hypothetical protein